MTPKIPKTELQSMACFPKLVAAGSICFACALLALPVSARDNGNPEPVYRYLAGDQLTAGVELSGPMRIVELDGRKGLHMTSVKSFLAIPKHNVGADRGSLTQWVMPLEDLANVQRMKHLEELEPDFDQYALLTDAPQLRKAAGGLFALLWRPVWWRPLMLRFISKENPVEGAGKVIVSPDDFRFHRLRWYQMGVSWNRTETDYRLYVNGVLIAASDPFSRDRKPFYDCGPKLYAGNPAFVVSAIEFYDRELRAEEFAAVYKAQQTQGDEDLMKELRHVHAGENVGSFSWQPDSHWIEQLSLPLNRAEDLNQFYVQGRTEAPKITPEGLLVTTGLKNPGGPQIRVAGPKGFPPRLLPNNDDREQVYLWTRRAFEGDIAVEFEFMPLKRNGLSLVMLQASGMQREDFMAEYPLRVTGSMSVVCWENVRNYHWEFFREMGGCRNDLTSHLLVKNPWMFGLAYQCLPGYLAQNQWHKLQFVQEGRRLRGGIDGRLIFDVQDDPFVCAGPVFDCGHVAIRAMWKSKFLYRNLKINTRKLPYRTRPLADENDGGVTQTLHKP